MKIYPTERAMGVVTLLSGLAVPLALFFGSRLFLEVTTQSARIFDGVCWVVNPFGVVLLEFGFPKSLWVGIGGYILGTMLSALIWGMIDGFIRARRSAD